MIDESSRNRIGVAGLSHLGLTTSICLAHLGFQVAAYDPDPSPVEAIAEGCLPIHEPGLDDLLIQNRDSLEASTRADILAGCELIIVALDTATDEANRTQLGQVADLVKEVLPHLAPDGDLALMSQVPCGFTRKLVSDLRPRLGSGKRVIYWVETLVIGDAVHRYLEPERTILGFGSEAREPGLMLDEVLDRLGGPVHRMSYESAELTKAAINYYLSVSVSYANSLADLAESVGASMAEMIPALREDRRIGRYTYINPGLGIAGGNLERDLVHLQELFRESGTECGLLDEIIRTNATRYRWAQARLEEAFFPLAEKPVLAIWGLAYKKDTASTKNSFSLRLIRELKDRAEIRVADPQARLPEDLEGEVVPGGRYEVAAGAHGLLIMTDWEEFSEIDFQRLAGEMKQRLIIDCVRLVDPGEAAAALFEVITLGEGARRG